jgi:hypothetical protein
MVNLGDTFTFIVRPADQNWTPRYKVYVYSGIARRSVGIVHDYVEVINYRALSIPQFLPLKWCIPCNGPQGETGERRWVQILHKTYPTVPVPERYINYINVTREPSFTQ